MFYLQVNLKGIKLTASRQITWMSATSCYSLSRCVVKLSIQTKLLFVSSSSRGLVVVPGNVKFRQKLKLRKLLLSFGDNLMNSLPNEPENSFSPPLCSWFHLDGVSIIFHVLVLTNGDVSSWSWLQGVAALSWAEVRAVAGGQTEVAAGAAAAVADWCRISVAILFVSGKIGKLVYTRLLSHFGANYKSPEFIDI